MTRGFDSQALPPTLSPFAPSATKDPMAAAAGRRCKWPEAHDALVRHNLPTAGPFGQWVGFGFVREWRRRPDRAL